MPTLIEGSLQSRAVFFFQRERKCEGKPSGFSFALDQAASLAKLDDAAEPRGSLQKRAVFLFSFFAFYDIVR